MGRVKGVGRVILLVRRWACGVGLMGVLKGLGSGCVLYILGLVILTRTNFVIVQTEGTKSVNSEILSQGYKL